MSIIIDLIIAGIIALCVIVGYAKGLTGALIKIVSFVLSLIIAFILYMPLSNYIINNTQIDNMIENTIISSFNHESLKICKKINKNIKTAALYSEPIEDIVNYAKELGVYAIHPDYKLVDKSLIKKCHENNILVNAYTVNEKEDIERLIEEGIDGIITDYPNIALEILKK